ncbi:MAG: phage holin family protein [Candidatus Gracilibacteria bacterium]|nr:phage holin family protein [Candidatus Gracilibacteria bacterium]
MYSLVFFLVLNTINVFLVSQVLDGFIVTGGWFGFAVVGFVIGLLNLFVKPFLKLLSLPFIFLTAGLFVIVVNAVILWMAQGTLNMLDLETVSLTIDGLGTYIAAVVLFGIVNYLFQKILR